jgi:hypothetical protein
MQGNLQIGLSFIGFGVFSFFLFNPANMSGKVAVAIMSIIFVLVGALFVWVAMQDNDE